MQVILFLHLHGKRSKFIVYRVREPPNTVSPLSISPPVYKRTATILTPRPFRISASWNISPSVYHPWAQYSTGIY